MSTLLRPTALAKLGDDRLQITWNDGRIGTIAWSTLREKCPCATCNEDRHKIFEPIAKPSHDGLSLRVLQEKEIPKHGPAKATSVAPVGKRRGVLTLVEKVGLYWHFVDLVWVFVFTFFYLV